MKSNFGKEKKEPKLHIEENVKAGSFRKTPKNIEMIQLIKEYVRKDYDKQIEALGEKHSLEILSQMLSTKYVKLFQPNTPEIKSIVKKCVARLIEKESEQKLGETLEIENISQKGDAKLQVELVKLKGIKASVGGNKEIGIDRLIETYNNELIRRREEKANEVAYYEAVKGYTRNFDFLAEDTIVYFSRCGISKLQKFKNVEQYSRFGELRNNVKHRMKNQHISEEEAIKDMLSTEDKKLKIADKKILWDRQNVLENKKDEVER